MPAEVKDATFAGKKVRVDPKEWIQLHGVTSRSYTCGYCGRLVGSNLGYSHQRGMEIQVCSYCGKPTYFDSDGEQIPFPLLGRAVSGLPGDIAALYDEARRCRSAGAPTSAVLTCRKILMHLAVEKQAKEGESFKFYVDHLERNGYIPPDGKDWVDHIRKVGNFTNHKIETRTDQDADAILSFVELLLRFTYEARERLLSATGKGAASS